jgi:hypothetical protein
MALADAVFCADSADSNSHRCGQVSVLVATLTHTDGLEKIPG